MPVWPRSVGCLPILLVLIQDCLFLNLSMWSFPGECGDKQVTMLFWIIFDI